MQTHEMYLRITDKQGGSHVQCRTVWDAERFLTSITKQYRDEGLKDGDPERFRVETITEAQYRHERQR